MRPINKGKSPYKNITKYSDAKPYLKKAIGEYCCYCEFPISHVPEADHVVSKSKDGSMTDWDNLLFSCKYCNTRKGDKVCNSNVDEYMWPDKYNTGLAFLYENGCPKVNIDELNQLDPSGNAARMAKSIYDLVDLGEIPNNDSLANQEKCKRFWKREEIRVCANDCLKQLEFFKNAGTPIPTETKRLIIDMAVISGFFSIWVTVLKDYPQILMEIINAYPGTEMSYFDSNGKIKKVIK